MDFTQESYKRALLNAKSAGARFIRPDEIFPMAIRPAFDGLTVILRHDVDRRLDRAVEMARLEHSIGVRSAFYLRFGPEYGFPDRLLRRFGSPYNIFSDHDAWAVREILRLGHEIGLHYEWVQWEQYGVDPQRLIALQANLMRLMFGLEYVGAAAHGSRYARETGKPNTAIFRSRGVTAEACGVRYFFYQELDKLSEFGCSYIYYSDAGGRWNQGRTIYDSTFTSKDPAGPRIVLIHPDWWVHSRLAVEPSAHLILTAFRRVWNGRRGSGT